MSSHDTTARIESSYKTTELTGIDMDALHTCECSDSQPEVG
jgi:molybdenum cofactor biosynthesis enzyme